jgi:hypothetical protein
LTILPFTTPDRSRDVPHLDASAYARFVRISANFCESSGEVPAG